MRRWAPEGAHVLFSRTMQWRLLHACVGRTRPGFLFLVCHREQRERAQGPYQRIHRNPHTRRHSLGFQPDDVDRQARLAQIAKDRNKLARRSEYYGCIKLDWRLSKRVADPNGSELLGQRLMA